jgi:hypothetical protein
MHSPHKEGLVVLLHWKKGQPDMLDNSFKTRMDLYTFKASHFDSQCVHHILSNSRRILLQVFIFIFVSITKHGTRLRRNATLS